MADVTDWKKSDAQMTKDWLGMARRDVAERDTPANRKELQKMQKLADEADASYKAQVARDARVGAGRGEVNPVKGKDYAKGGAVKAKGWGKARGARKAKVY